MFGTKHMEVDWLHEALFATSAAWEQWAKARAKNPTGSYRRPRAEPAAAILSNRREAPDSRI